MSTHPVNANPNPAPPGPPPAVQTKPAPPEMDPREALHFRRVTSARITCAMIGAMDDHDHADIRAPQKRRMIANHMADIAVTITDALTERLKRP